MMVIIGVILLLIVGTFIYVTKLPQIGKKPSGNRLEKLMNSKNYRDNVFQNRDETNMEKPPWEGIKEMLKKGVDRTPSKPIKTISIDRNKFDNATKDELLVTWLGHSTLLMKINGTTILIDPVFSKRASLFQFIGPKKFEYTNDYSVDDLPKIDIVLITHDHYDHLDYMVIKELKNKVDKFYMPLGVGSHFEHWGISNDNITELDWWESFKLDGIEITATPGRHFTGRLFDDRFKTLWCGWAIKTSKHSIYHSGDSGYFDGFKEIGEKLGPFEMAFMECGQYSKYWPYIHMMPEESVQASIDVRSAIAIPIHWGKFNLSIHSWYDSPNRFLKKAKELDQEIAIPRIGKIFSLKNDPLENWWK